MTGMVILVGVEDEKKLLQRIFFAQCAHFFFLHAKSAKKIFFLCNHYKIMLKLFTNAHFVILKHLEHLVGPFPVTNWC